MKRLRLLVFILVLLVPASFCLGALADTMGLAHVTDGNLHMRAEAASSGSIVKTYASGSTMMILGEAGDDWFKVSAADGNTGYMMKKYLTVFHGYNSWKTGTVYGDNVGLYENTSLSTLLGSMPDGSQVDVLDRFNGAYLVHFGEKVGYVDARYVDVLPQAPADYTYRQPDEAVHEVGENSITTLWNETTNYQLSYPVFGMSEADEAIKNWTEEQIQASRQAIQTDAPTASPTVAPTVAATVVPTASATVAATLPPVTPPVETPILGEDGDMDVSFFNLAGIPAPAKATTSAPRGLGEENPAVENEPEESEQRGNEATTVPAWEPTVVNDPLQLPGQMTMAYQSFLMDGRYAGAIILSDYINSATGETSTSAFAITADLQTGKALTGVDLFTEEARGTVLQMLTQRLSLAAIPAGMTLVVDVDWLKSAVMTTTGVTFVLSAGQYLPPEMGTLAVTLPYKTVKNLMAVPVSDAMLAAAEPAVSTERVIDPSKPMVALTFDDGPSENTLKILDLLAAYNGRATFCVVGTQLAMFPEILQREVSEGQCIASHTYSHRDLTAVSESTVVYQITNVIDTVREQTGYEIKFLRPPYGNVNTTVKSVCKKYDIIIATWELDSRDWSNKSTRKIISNIKNEVKDGTIILCHDLYDFTANAMETIIPWLVDEGYQLVTLEELFQYHKDYASGAMYGKVYSHLSRENLVLPEE